MKKTERCYLKIRGKLTEILVSALMIILPFFMVSAEEIKKSIETAKDIFQLESIVVTAQKRKEKIQDVPMSMDVFSELQLDEAGITDMKELTYYSPNLYSKQNTNQNMLIVRGISSHNVVLHTPVGLFVDEINYPMTFMQNPDLVNVERVEILRGPQGTLYGRNTEAGAVKVVTRQPNNEPFGKVFAEIGQYDVSKDDPTFFRYGASYLGPLVEDRFYIGLAYQARESKGRAVNIYNDDQEVGKISHQSGQATLRWTPSDPLDISLIMNTYTSDDGYGYARYSEGPYATDRYTINWDGANTWKDTNSGQALKIDYLTDNFRFLSITTQNAFETATIADVDMSPMPMGDMENRLSVAGVGQEFRILSPEENASLDWLMGLYTFQDKTEVDFSYYGMERATEYDGKGNALFGQVTYSPTAKLHLTGGLRYDQYESEGTQAYNLIADSYSSEVDHAEWLPKGVVAYDFTEDLMGYVSAAKGILAGGYNYATATNSNSLTFDAEKTMNYEVGMKLGSADQRLMVSAALFKIDIRDKQVQEYVVGGNITKVTNAAKASTTGAELDFQYAANPNLMFFGGYGMTNAKIEQWTADESTGGQYDFSGKKLAFSPEYTYSLGASFSFADHFNVRGDINGVGSFYSDEKNLYKNDAYELVNLSAGYKAKALEVSLWAKNVFDKEYTTMRAYYGSGQWIAGDGAPRSIGITTAYLF